MAFNSLEFLIFFPVVVAFYFLFPSSFRWVILFIASCFFYVICSVKDLPVLFLNIGVGYLIGLLVQKSTTSYVKRFYFIIGLLIIIIILAYYKFSDFISPSNILLPLGISFFAFRSISYLIEVQAGNIPAEKNLGMYSLYIMFFPQMISGPIDRPQSLLPQLRSAYAPKYESIVNGLRLMLWGFMKKIIIADRLSYFVNIVFDHPNDFMGYQIICAVFLFAFQIYCDFSAYTDIAIGAGKVLGFNTPKNFDRPYLATSITDFWRRWHISLSSWLRDYIFTPLTIKLRYWKLLGVVFSLLTTFLICGVWHGSGWNYILWGALNGLLLSVEAIGRNFGKKLKIPKNIERLINPFKILLTFFLVSFSWLFFKSSSLEQVWILLKNETMIKQSQVGLFMISKDNNDVREFLLSFFFIGVLLLTEYLFLSKQPILKFSKIPLLFRWMIYVSIVILIMCIGSFHSAQQFIYFNF